METNLIYYCRFGPKKLDEKQLKILKNWHNQGYETFEINEDNFPINDYLFAKTAYEAEKYAFVSDVARIYYLYNYGGIYLDTDVEIVKNLEKFCLKSKIVISFEYFEWELTGLNMGTIIAPKHSKQLAKLLAYYQTNYFQKTTMNEQTINKLWQKIIFQNNLKINNLVQETAEYLILPAEYFCVKNKQSYTIHHYAQSWKDKTAIKFKIRRRIGKMIKKIIGTERFNKIWKKD